VASCKLPFFDNDSRLVRRHDTIVSEIMDDNEADWVDDDTITSILAPDAFDAAPIKVEGYIQKKTTRNGVFHRSFCVLSPNNMLLFYKKKSKVSDHVSSSTAHYNVSTASELSISESGLDITLLFDSIKGELILRAYTSDEGAMWYAGICCVIHGRNGKECSYHRDLENGSKFIEQFDYRMKEPQIFYRSLHGFGGDASVESCEQLPLHSGPLSRCNVLSYNDCKHFEVLQPGVLFGFKSVADAERGDKNKSKIKLSLQDVLAVTQCEDDMSCFVVNLKDKSFKFEALSENLASEWCQVIIHWVKYFTEISNESLLNTQLHLQSNSTFTSDHAMVEMVRSPLNSDNISNYMDQGASNVITSTNENLGNFYLIKAKNSLFSTRSWQRRWVFVDKSWNLSICENRPVVSNAYSSNMEIIQLSSIIAVEICAVNACCVHIHERGIHRELQADTLFNALSFRNLLLSKIVASREQILNSSPQPPSISKALSDGSTVGVVTEVLDTLIQNVEREVHGIDAIEIEPFSRESSFFRPMDSGLNPLHVFLNHESVKARRSTNLDKHADFYDLILDPSVDTADLKEDVVHVTRKSSRLELVKDRSDSYADNDQFLKLNSKVDEDDFANKLKTQSYQDLNKEFWTRHKWYLTAVVCFVTLNVLSVTSYMIRETDF